MSRPATRHKRAAYPAYKPSGMDWVGDIPEHWEIVRVKYALVLQRGVDLPVTEMKEGDYPVYGSNGVIGYHDQYTTKGPGVTVGRSGSVGEVNWVDRDFWAHNTALYVKYYPRTQERFAFYLLSTIDLKAISAGSAVGTLNRNYIHDVYCALPSLSEQKGVAAFLDRETARIDGLIEKKRRQIELLQEKRSALISHAVTKGLDPNASMKNSGIEWLGEIPAHWEVRSIRRIAEAVKTGGTPAGAEEMHFDQNGFNWYTPSDFHEDVTLSGSSRRLSEIGKKEVRVFPAMTVMMVGIGATIGKVALSRAPSSCNQQINAIVCNSKMNPHFLTYFLRIMRAYIFRCGKFTTLPIINQEDTKALIITCPPLPEQDAIVSILDNETERTDALIGKIQMSIDKLREYRTALISAAVTGKIDVRTMPAGRQEEVS